ncbi:hypothetical protein Ancab_014496 [Ancistrocladus abbreviatus]
MEGTRMKAWWTSKHRTGKSQEDTGVKQHRQSYADAVNGMAPRTGMKHNSADTQSNEKMAPRTGIKHNSADTQNNEKPLLVLTSEEEDGTSALVVEGKEAVGIMDTGTTSDSQEDGTTTADDMVNCIKSMEQRDLKNFLESVQVPEADCVPEDRVVQSS